jgi:hypothetical protein
MEKSLELVRQLVDDFREHEKAYLAPTYQESQVRQDFIDKFFTALGWDVSHQRQKNPYEQEVKIENKVSTQGSQRRADYAFFISPNYRDVKFFVEAKKPAHDLTNANYYYQTVRYGWNKTTPIAILTDFEEFHILDCRYKPNIKTALDHKIEMFHYLQYTDEEIFKKIFYLFGRDAVAGGSLEKFAETLSKPRSKGAKKGIVRGKFQQVDEAFLELLDGYRDTLAHAFKNKNPNLDGESLTEAVQRTLDRLVFIRFLEDKGIEESMIINLSEKQSAWDKFLALCRGMEPKYNGLVFKQHPVIDSQTFVAPDDKTFGEICGEISDPTSPYDFNTIPISILGSIYERFLGKIVTTTDKRAKVVEKPEVRKAGWVYYTPEYIVRYIVNETVGRLLYEDPNQDTPRHAELVSASDPGSVQIPKQVRNDALFKITPPEVAKLKIIDIACGSGSFLLEVYNQLLDYHTRYYNEFPEKAKKGDTETREGKIVLSHKKRQEILVNNIYGVDIDFQATEVTQLSLYLKLMEDVTMNDAYQFSLLKERMLPDLRRNIVCGNSLIGRDILDGKLFDDETEHTLKPMNFEDVFPEIMTPSVPTKKIGTSPPSQGGDKEGVGNNAQLRGGFDVVVGNPPYVRQESLGEFKSYFETHYKVFHGIADLYTYFIEKGFSLLRNGGLFSYIVANKWMRANYGAPLRRWLKEQCIEEIIDFGDLPVFKGATTYPCIIRIKKSYPKKSLTVVQVKSLESLNLDVYASEHGYPVAQESLQDSGWSLSNENTLSLLEKLKKNCKPLGEYVNGKIFYGIKTGLNEAFVIDKDTKNKIILDDSKSKELIKPFLAGRDIKRYIMPEITKYLILIPSGWTNKSSHGNSDKWNWFENTYSAIAKHLKGYEADAKARYDQGDYWWELRSCDYYPEFNKPKIMLPDISTRGNFILDDQETYCVNTCYIISNSDKYLLGILNSKLITFFYSKVSSVYRGGYLRFIYQYLVELPIRIINFEDAADKARHDHIVSLVEQMLAAKAKHAAATTESEKNRLDIQIEALDRQIDAAVYELYGLSEEEKRIVEGRI